MPLKKGEQQLPALETKHSLGLLLMDLTAEQSERRLEAAQALADLPEAASALCKHLAVETDRQVQQIILTSFILNPQLDIAQQLSILMLSAELSLRNQIAEVLEHYPPSFLPMASTGLADPVSSHRLIWLQIMRDWPVELLSELLVPLLPTEADVNVFASMVELLAQTEDQSLLPALQQVSNRFPDEPYIQYLLAQSLTRLRR